MRVFRERFRRGMGLEIRMVRRLEIRLFLQAPVRTDRAPHLPVGDRRPAYAASKTVKGGMLRCYEHGAVRPFQSAFSVLGKKPRAARGSDRLFGRSISHNQARLRQSKNCVRALRRVR